MYVRIVISALNIRTYRNEKSYTGVTAFDLKRGLNHIFFYCDVLSWRAVGDVRALLLVVLPNKMEEIFGAITTRRFKNM